MDPINLTGNIRKLLLKALSQIVAKSREKEKKKLNRSTGNQLVNVSPFRCIKELLFFYALALSSKCISPTV